MFDRVFQIIFARFRRQYGDSNLEFAWRRATTTVSGYLVLPIAGAVIVVVMLIYALTGAGTIAQHLEYGQVVGVILWLCSFALLRRRLKRFLSRPRVLIQEEALSDARYVFWFRIGTAALFALACVVGSILHGAGRHLLRGM
jgi:hypothetical protein